MHQHSIADNCHDPSRAKLQAATSCKSRVYLWRLGCRPATLSQEEENRRAGHAWGIYRGSVQRAGGRPRICPFPLHLAPVAEGLHLALLPLLLCRPHHVPFFITLCILCMPKSKQLSLDLLAFEHDYQLLVPTCLEVHETALFPLAPSRSPGRQTLIDWINDWLSCMLQSDCST